MVFVTVVLLSLYSVVLPLLSLYLFREYDSPRFYQLKSYYENCIAGLLGPSSSTAASNEVSSVIDEGKSYLYKFGNFLSTIFRNSLIYSGYMKLSTNKTVVRNIHKLKVQLTPFYRDQIVPILVSWDKFKLKLMLKMRPYYLEALNYVAPRYGVLKKHIISLYNVSINSIKPHYDTLIDEYFIPIYEKFVAPHVETCLNFYFKELHPFYLAHEDQINSAAYALTLSTGAFVFYRLFIHKPITPLIEYMLSDIHDFGKGLDEKYKSEIPSEVTTSLIGAPDESQTELLLKAVRKLDATVVVKNGKNLTSIANSGSTSFNDESPTRVDSEARPPYSQKKQEKKTTKGQNKKNLKDSFLDSSLANGKLDLNDHHAHLCTQVQVQFVDENGNVEIEEEIEDELAGKGEPDGDVEIASNEDEDEVENNENEESGERLSEGEFSGSAEDVSDDDDDLEEENTDDAISRRLNSVSDSSSDNEDERNKSKIPKVFSEFESPVKYNTGLFYSTSRNSLLNAAIPRTPSPTKADFGLLYEEKNVEVMNYSNKSVMMTSSIISKMDNESSNLSLKSTLMTNVTPSKPSTACVNEETVYAFGGDSEKESNGNDATGGVLLEISSSIRRTSMS